MTTHTKDTILITPTPGFVIKTTASGPSSSPSTELPTDARKIFLNICGDKGIAAIHQTTRLGDGDIEEPGISVPIAVGPMRTCVDRTGAAALVVDLIFHPSTLADIPRDPSGAYRHWVVETALAYVENKAGLSLSRRYKLPAGCVYKGGDVAAQSVRRILRPQIAEYDAIDGTNCSNGSRRAPLSPAEALLAAHALPSTTRLLPASAALSIPQGRGDAETATALATANKTTEQARNFVNAITYSVPNGKVLRHRPSLPPTDMRFEKRTLASTTDILEGDDERAGLCDLNMVSNITAQIQTHDATTTGAMLSRTFHSIHTPPIKESDPCIVPLIQEVPDMRLQSELGVTSQSRPRTSHESITAVHRNSPTLSRTSAQVDKMQKTLIGLTPTATRRLLPAAAAAPATRPIRVKKVTQSNSGTSLRATWCTGAQSNVSDAAALLAPITALTVTRISPATCSHDEHSDSPDWSGHVHVKIEALPRVNQLQSQHGNLQRGRIVVEMILPTAETMWGSGMSSQNLPRIYLSRGGDAVRIVPRNVGATTASITVELPLGTRVAGNTEPLAIVQDADIHISTSAQGSRASKLVINFDNLEVTSNANTIRSTANAYLTPHAIAALSERYRCMRAAAVLSRTPVASLYTGSSNTDRGTGGGSVEAPRTVEASGVDQATHAALLAAVEAGASNAYGGPDMGSYPWQCAAMSHGDLIDAHQKDTETERSAVQLHHDDMVDDQLPEHRFLTADALSTFFLAERRKARVVNETVAVDAKKSQDPNGTHVAALARPSVGEVDAKNPSPQQATQLPTLRLNLV